LRAFRERGGNRLQHAVDISNHVVVPKAQDAVAMLDQPLIACGVALVGGVLSTIDFNDQPALAADEVDNERSHWLLADEFLAVNGATAQPIPKLEFGMGGLMPEAAGAFGRDLVGSAYAAISLTRPSSPRLRCAD
jgi:hypothetical protein